MTIYTSRHRTWHLTNTQEKIDSFITPDVRERFWSKVDKRSDSECWTWHGTRTFHGYGNFAIRCIAFRANRIAYMIVKGPIPADLHVLHLCDNRACCNPAHLVAGTVQQNNAQRDAQLKCTKGEKHHSARLTDRDVLEIMASDRRYCDLARRYGVCGTTIQKIKEGRTWKHLTRAMQQ